MQTNPAELTHQPPPLLGFHTLGHYLPGLISPGPDTRQPRRAPVPQSLLELFKLDNSKPTYPVLLVPSCRNYKKRPLSTFPPFLLPPGWPWCFPEWPCMACSLLLETVGNKLSFQWQPSDLLSSPYLDNNKTYIFQQSWVGCTCIITWEKWTSMFFKTLLFSE